MDVVVDGKSNFELKGAPSNVFAVVAAVNEFLQEQGRGILSISVDGVVVPPSRLLDSLKEKPLGDVQVLEVKSERVAELVETYLRELDAVLGELPKACHELGAIFQGERPEEGYEPFHHLAEIWREVKSRESIVAEALHLPLDTFDLDGVPLTQLHTELNGYLAEAAEALQANDCVLLGDLLEYELAPRAENEAKIVALLREQARKRAG